MITQELVKRMRNSLSWATNVQKKFRLVPGYLFLFLSPIFSFLSKCVFSWDIVTQSPKIPCFDHWVEHFISNWSSFLVAGERSLSAFAHCDNCKCQTSLKLLHVRTLPCWIVEPCASFAAMDESILSNFPVMCRFFGWSSRIVIGTIVKNWIYLPCFLFHLLLKVRNTVSEKFILFQYSSWC